MVLRILAVILAVWEPLNVAAWLAPIFPTLGQRGYASTAFVVVRLMVAGISVAAGIALWQRQPDAVKVASVALVLSTAAAAVTYTTRLLPSNTMPGDALFWLALVVCSNGAWLAYLWQYSRRA